MSDEEWEAVRAAIRLIGLYAPEGVEKRTALRVLQPMVGLYLPGTPEYVAYLARVEESR